MGDAPGSDCCSMIDFNRSFITWTIDWAEPDPVYAYPGGFVGEPGEATTSRVQIDAACEIVDEARGETCTLYLSAPCRSEFIIAKDNLFQVPNGEFRAAVSDACMVPIAAEPSWQDEGTRRQPVGSRFAACRHRRAPPRSGRARVFRRGGGGLAGGRPPERAVHLP